MTEQDPVRPPHHEKDDKGRGCAAGALLVTGAGWVVVVGLLIVTGLGPAGGDHAEMFDVVRGLAALIVGLAGVLGVVGALLAMWNGGSRTRLAWLALAGAIMSIAGTALLLP